jgi:uncharacterized protein YjlB
MNIISTVLVDTGVIPNSTLPLVAYRQAVVLSADDPAATFEQSFRKHGWGNDWRNGVYAHHHYHSTAHEVLGVYAGSATIRFGGEPGMDLEVGAGDVVVIPAGVGHKRLVASSDFAVVGAYPDGQRPDMNVGEPGERPRVDQTIAGLALPLNDPVFGPEGPLSDHWKRGQTVRRDDLLPS